MLTPVVDLPFLIAFQRPWWTADFKPIRENTLG